MHGSIGDYRFSRVSVGRSPLSVNAARSDITGFATWWERRRQWPFDPTLLLSLANNIDQRNNQAYVYSN